MRSATSSRSTSGRGSVCASPTLPKPSGRGRSPRGSPDEAAAAGPPALLRRAHPLHRCPCRERPNRGYLRRCLTVRVRLRHRAGRDSCASQLPRGDGRVDHDRPGRHLRGRSLAGRSALHARTERDLHPIRRRCRAALRDGGRNGGARDRRGHLRRRGAGQVRPSRRRCARPRSVPGRPHRLRRPAGARDPAGPPSAAFEPRVHPRVRRTGPAVGTRRDRAPQVPPRASRRSRPGARARSRDAVRRHRRGAFGDGPRARGTDARARRIARAAIAGRGAPSYRPRDRPHHGRARNRRDGVSTKDIAARYATEIHRVVVGQDETVRLSFIALLLRGHLLIEGVPGTAKTLLARTVARLIGGTFKRIQFTPDLMPSDVVGTTVYEISTSSFRTRTGPVFANVVLADEINRAPAKTQSALLEAMEERQVTLEGESLALPDPFLVLATQNPVEYEGTYPLPEAELDRFVFKAIVRYPSADDERAILRAHDRGQPSAKIVEIDPFPHGTLEECRGEIENVTVEDSVLDYVVRIAAESRRSPDLILGASPRAAVHLLRAAKAAAAIDGRDFVTPDDVKSLATPTLRHRLVLKAEAEIEGLDADAVCKRVLARLDVPR